MRIVLFWLGIATAAAGLISIGFGIPVNAFSFGNALIVAGTVAVVGGFILIGLAATMRQLSEVAEAIAQLSAHLAKPPAALAEAGERVIPAKPTLAPARPISERRSAAEPGPLAWLRPQAPASHAKEAAPDTTARPPPRQTAAETHQATRAEPAAAEKAPSFEAVWPERASERADKLDAASPRGASERAAGRSDERRPVSILKSGVIDGMTYTLYTDGSIEAELPSGTLRFASIEELRLHLEKNE